MDPAKATKFRVKAEQLLAAGKPDKALDQIIKSLDQHPDNPLAWELQGIIQMELRFDREAAQSFSEAIKRNPESELSYIHLSRILRSRKDLFKAMGVLAKLADIKPESYMLQQTVLDILENEDTVWEELFKVQPEILIKVLNHAADEEFKYKMTGLLKRVAVERSELFLGKAFNVIRSLADSDDDEIRNTAYILLVAVFEANPREIVKNFDLVEKGIKDSNKFVLRSTAGVMKSLLEYFPNFLFGHDEIIVAALENPTIAEQILKIIPPCPKCKSQDNLYLQKLEKDEKLIRLYCETCDVDFYKSPGMKVVEVIDDEELKLSGPVICPLCHGQFLKWVDDEKLYTCSVCNKWFTA